MKPLLWSLALLAAATAAAKSPFQLSGVLESAAADANGVTLTLSGVLQIQNFQPKSDAPSVNLSLSRARVSARRYSVLSGSGQEWKKQDVAAVENLLSLCRDQGHKVRGGAAGVSVTFSELGAVESVVVDELSLIDSTIIDGGGK